MAEFAIYSIVSLVLVASAFAVLVASAYSLATELGHGVKKAVESSVDSLLIVFILVELLSAVRTTLSERRLVAEPFLLVGIIASIKEVVVIGSFAGERSDPAGDMVEIGVLGSVVVGLAIATFLLRRKEREPEE